MEGRAAGDLLMPPMHRGRFTRQLDWANKAGGRTVHDLRHTAICVWIAAGVYLATVRAWAGHADLGITSRYVHHLGSEADRAAAPSSSKVREPTVTHVPLRDVSGGLEILSRTLCPQVRDLCPDQGSR